MLATAGAELPGDRIIDGVDLVSHAMAEPQIELDRPLYWRSDGYKSVQQNGWKLQLQEQNGKSWLFNLNEDPTEIINLSESMPEKLAELTEILYALDGEMVEPLWPTLSQGRVTVDHTLRAPPEESMRWSFGVTECRKCFWLNQRGESTGSEYYDQNLQPLTKLCKPRI